VDPAVVGGSSLDHQLKRLGDGGGVSSSTTRIHFLEPSLRGRLSAHFGCLLQRRVTLTCARGIYLSPSEYRADSMLTQNQYRPGL
jgi:hypothetical protein